MPTSGYVDKFKRNNNTYDIQDTLLRNTIGQASGLATLDSNGKVPVSQLPVATTEANGVMSSTDKVKVDKIDTTTTSVNGNPISIPNLKSNQLAIDPIITLEPIQAGSGDPSPSNIREISGYDKIEVLSRSKNVLNILGQNPDKGFITGHYIAYGAVSDIAYDGFISEYSPIKPNTTYVLSGFDGISPGICFYDSNKNYLSGQVYNGQTYITFTTASDVYYYRASIANKDKYLMQLEEGTTPTALEVPITDLTIQLGQTIYGGTLDLEKGVLRVDRKCIDLGDLEWQRQYEQGDNVYRFLTTSTINNIGGTISEFSYYENVICSIYKNHINTPTLLDNICFVYNTGYLYVYDSRYTDATAFKTAVTGQKLCYKLATPITIQLTPHEISLLSNYAYVSTNGTNLSFSYHNGEMASLGDVAQVGQTVNNLVNIMPLDISNRIAINNTITFPTPYGGKVVAYKYGKVVYVGIYAMQPVNTGDAQIIVSGLPKAIAQSGGIFSGENSSYSTTVITSGNVFWISTGDTRIMAHFGINNRLMWGYLMYFTSE